MSIKGEQDIIELKEKPLLTEESMTITDFKNYSTLEAIKNSIDTDTHVYRWFLFLVIQPAVQSQITNIEEASKSYKILRSTMRAQKIAGGIFLLSILLGLFLQETSFLWASVLFLYPIFRLHMKKKKCVISISQHLLESDPEQSLLMKQTLYKISEQYSRRYKIPSIVDYICASNRILRWTILGGFVLTIVILPFRGIQSGITFLIVYLTVYSFVNSTAIYKYIK